MVAFNKIAPIRHYAVKGHLRRGIIINQYFKRNPITRLQVGCGQNRLEGWLNADLAAGDIYFNAKRRMPFNDNSFNFIFFEHFIEHLDKENGFRFLTDCFRVLKTNGIIRITSPDLEKIIDIYYDRNQFVTRQEVIDAYGKGSDLEPCELFNDYMHQWGHKFIYDRKMIESTLADIGFDEITFCDCKKSKHKELTNLERHLEKHSFLNPAETFVVEAKKK